MHRVEEALLQPAAFVGVPTQKSFQNVVLLKLAEGVLAKNQRDPTRAYIEAHTYWPPQIFILTVSFMQVGLFLYWAATCPQEVDIWNFCGGCFVYANVSNGTEFDIQPTENLWTFNSGLRYQVWRFFSYAFLHFGLWHLTSNVVVQLIVGVPLEVVHRMARIGSLYILAVISGAMVEYISNPSTGGVGCSAGVYALLCTLVSNLFINWDEVPRRKLKAAIILGYLGTDIFISVILPRLLGHCQNISHAGHVGGAITGFLYGVFILRNVVEHRWERILRRVCVVLYVFFFISCVVLVIVIEPYSKPPWSKEPCLDDPTIDWHNVNLTEVIENIQGFLIS